MRTTKVFSITLPPAMLKEVEELAKKEHRTKSELVREALRQYIRDQEWSSLRKIGSRKAKELGIKPRDVERLVHEYRGEKQGRSSKKKAG